MLMNKGHIAEMLVIKELNKRGFYIKWLTLTGSDPYDIAAVKDGKNIEIRIEVKSTPTDYGIRYINKTQPNKNTHFIIVVKGVKRNRDGYKSCDGFWVIPTFKPVNEDVDRYRDGFIQLDQFIGSA